MIASTDCAPVTPKYDTYVLGLAFANYLTSKSGMPKAVMADQHTTNAHGVSYVYLFSVKKTLGRDDRLLFCEFGLIVDGGYCGIFSLGQILGLMGEWSDLGKRLLEIHLHHLLFVSLTKVDRLLSVASGASIKVFLHDYYLCCTSFSLQKDGEFCGATFLGDAPCADCPCYKQSVRVESHLTQLLSRYRERMTFVAPSEDVKKRFATFHPDFARDIEITPHQRFVGRYTGNSKELAAEDPIRIAYLGLPQHMKGWDAWLRVQKALDGQGYEFYVFNSADEQYEGMTHIKVSFDAEHPNAMVDALRRHEVSQAMLYTTCPETYSYTCMEAWSANAFVLTSLVSGNVCDFVHVHDCGLAFSSEQELINYLEDRDRVIGTLNAFRKHSNAPQELVDNDQIASGLPPNSFAIQLNETNRTSLPERLLVALLNRLVRW